MTLYISPVYQVSTSRVTTPPSSPSRLSKPRSTGRSCSPLSPSRLSVCLKKQQHAIRRQLTLSLVISHITYCIENNTVGNTFKQYATQYIRTLKKKKAIRIVNKVDHCEATETLIIISNSLKLWEEVDYKIAFCACLCVQEPTC